LIHLLSAASSVRGRLRCALIFLYISFLSLFFFFTDPAPTEIYTLSLHDALPISGVSNGRAVRRRRRRAGECHLGRHGADGRSGPDRKSTRLNSSHQIISYAVFCLKKKKKRNKSPIIMYKNTI